MLRRSIIFVFTTTCLGAAVAASGCGVNPAFDCTNRNISCGDDDAGLTAHSDAQTSDTASNDAGPNAACCDASGEDGPVVIPPDSSDAAAACSGSDPDHCGASCAQCSGPPSGNGNAVCSAGTCGITCAGNYFLCNGDCHALSADPSDACVVAESIGVFVAPAGQDAAGKGTRAAPFATIGYAVQHANGHPRVYVQAGTYVGAVNIGASAPAVAIFGGFDSTWNYDPAHQSVKVQAPAGSAALSISGATASLTVANIEFDSGDAQGNGGSSIAAQVSASSGSIAFAHCAFSAGKGTPGTSGATPTGPLPAAATGNAADTGTNNGGPAKECTCPFGVPSYGGQGGAGGATPTDGANGQPQLSSNKGTAGSLGIACGGGTKGADAPAVAADGPGAPTSGAIANSTWGPAAGTNGTGGGSGQGGGGGGGTYNALPTSSGNGGSGGGCGGCGGGGGGAGGGGGGSVGVLVVQASSVSFTECSVKTAGGGNGGAGAGGQLGIPGAGPGASTNGCPGAGGGAGGKGGAGGGGAGGISVGILWQGTVAPSVDGPTQSAIVVGQAGSLGKGGNSPSNDGIPGSSAPVLQVP